MHVYTYSSVFICAYAFMFFMRAYLSMCAFMHIEWCIYTRMYAAVCTWNQVCLHNEREFLYVWYILVLCVCLHDTVSKPVWSDMCMPSSLWVFICVWTSIRVCMCLNICVCICCTEGTCIRCRVFLHAQVSVCVYICLYLGLKEICSRDLRFGVYAWATNCL